MEALHWILVLSGALLALIVGARLVDQRTGWSASRPWGWAAVAIMDVEWARRRKSARIIGRCVRLHSLCSLFAPPPRLIRRNEEAMMSIGVLVLSFVTITAFQTPTPPPAGTFAVGENSTQLNATLTMPTNRRQLRFNPFEQLTMSGLLASFMVTFGHWTCRVFFTGGNSATNCGRVTRICAWLYSLAAYAMSAVYIMVCFRIYGEVTSAHVVSQALSTAVVYWVVFEPIFRLGVSFSMELCECCRRGCCEEKEEKIAASS